jgi:hypothetical protein
VIEDRTAAELDAGLELPADVAQATRDEAEHHGFIGRHPRYAVIEVEILPRIPIAQEGPHLEVRRIGLTHRVQRRQCIIGPTLQSRTIGADLTHQLGNDDSQAVSHGGWSCCPRVLLFWVLVANLVGPAIAGAAPVETGRDVPGGPEVAPGRELRHTPTLAAVRTDKPPEVDGRLDDAAWQAASVETSFTQNFPDEGKPPTERTELRVLYDDDAIYIAIRCFDSHPKEIVGRLTRRDRDIDGDKVMVEISSKNDKASAYHFQVNPAGVQVDGIRFNDTELGTDWDGLWYSATSRDAQGWTAELKIPLVTLRYSGSVSSFGFQVRRYLQRRAEIDEWTSVPRTAKGEVSYYGTLGGITGLHAKRLVELLAYASGKSTFRSGQAAFDGSAAAGNMGADLKLGVTPALTLDATINPDFGTVETDQVVLNLSTVETYLPEKRPFFLEGADIFATKFNLFYTRRVGAHPADPTLGPGAELREPLPDGRIWGAAKLTGLVGDRLSVGVLDAITSREDATVARTSGATPEKLLVEPLSNFGVLRVRRDFGTNSSVGVLGTAVNRSEPAGAAAPQTGDLCPVPYSTTFTSLTAPPPSKGRCSNDAYTAGLDTVLRTSDGEWGASGQVVGSLIENGPTRLIPDGTQIGSGTRGWGVISEAGRYGGENWLFKVGYTSSSPSLQINDAGFQDQANFQEGYASLMWRTTKPAGPFLSTAIELWLAQRRDWSLQDSFGIDPHLDVTLQLSNFWTVFALVSPYYAEWVENRETQDGARTQRNGGSYWAFSMKTDPNKPVVLELTGTLDKRLRGWALRSTGKLSLRPIPALELDLIPSFNWTYGAPRWISTEQNMDGSRTYFFSDLDSKSFDVILRGTYAFTRTLSLQAYLQPFVASGHFSRVTSSTVSGNAPLLTLASFVDTTLPGGTNPDFRDGAINLNVFVRWEYLPLSALWLVYTHEQQQTAYDPMDGPGRIRFDRFAGGPTTDVLLLKLSYLWF